MSDVVKNTLCGQVMEKRGTGDYNEDGQEYKIAVCPLKENNEKITRAIELLKDILSDNNT